MKYFPFRFPAVVDRSRLLGIMILFCFLGLASAFLGKPHVFHGVLGVLVPVFACLWVLTHVACIGPDLPSCKSYWIVGSGEGDIVSPCNPGIYTDFSGGGYVFSVYDGMTLELPFVGFNPLTGTLRNRIGCVFSIQPEVVSRVGPELYKWWTRHIRDHFRSAQWRRAEFEKYLVACRDGKNNDLPQGMTISRVYSNPC